MSKRNPKNKRQSAKNIEQVRLGSIKNHLTPIEIVSEDELESLHMASLEVLAEHGVKFSLDKARNILKSAGASVDESTCLVKFDPDLLMSLVEKSPSSFILHARNPENNLIIGNNYLNFSSVSSAPYCTDRINGRRSGTRKDFKNFLRLTQVLNVAHGSGGYPVEPMDIPVPIRHLHAVRDILTLTDKTFRIYTHNRQRTLDALELTRLAHDISKEEFTNKPCVFASINPNSPREYDESMLHGMIECAKAGQALMISPFILAGAMAPTSIAGAVVQQNAEALAGVAFCQLVRPGTPITYGGFVSNVDMKSGSPAFGTPEQVKTTLLIGQLARRYRLPYRSTNANTSNTVDSQATYESQMCLWASLLSGSNYVYHGLGWLEGGLSASYEKFILDAEMIQGLFQILKPINFSTPELAVETIGEVSPGGHFLGTSHTMERYKQAFHHPFLSDWRNYEAWTEAGAPDTTARATDIVTNLLDNYSEPLLNTKISQNLNDFVAHRESEGGSPLQ